jgi:hypothetical protein
MIMKLGSWRVWSVNRGCLLLLSTWSHLQGSVLTNLFLRLVIPTCVCRLIPLWYLCHFIDGNKWLWLFHMMKLFRCHFISHVVELMCSFIWSNYFDCISKGKIYKWYYVILHNWIFKRCYFLWLDYLDFTSYNEVTCKWQNIHVGKILSCLFSPMKK